MGSLDDKQMVFIVGAPRSGTTWLSHMLISHPVVVGLERELTVFANYLPPIVNAWLEEKGHMDAGDWDQGLPLVWNEKDFKEFLERFVEAVYSRVIAANPEATHVVDKHPPYAHHTHLIRELFPAAKIIHIIRDGRAVVRSLRSAYERVGFGTADTRKAVWIWADSVRCAREAGQYGDSAYCELRYEALCADTVEELRRVFAFCGLSCDDGVLDRIVAEHTFSIKAVSSPTPRSEVDRGLSLREAYTLEKEAGSLMRELGYADSRTWWRSGPGDSVRAVPLFVRRKLYALAFWLAGKLDPSVGLDRKEG